MKHNGRNAWTFIILAIIFAGNISFSAADSGQEKSSGVGRIDRIRRVEEGIPPIALGAGNPPLHLDIQMLMELFNVPGLSVAVIDNYKIAWAKGYGVTEAGSAKPVTVHTLFQAGSISNPVAAAGALYLVEQGKLSLDQDVNKN